MKFQFTLSHKQELLRIKNNFILPNLKQGEELIGFFAGEVQVSLWWWLVFGPLTFLGFRLIYVAVTNQGLQLHKCNVFLRPSSFNFFNYDEISELNYSESYGSGILKLRFQNGRELKVGTILFRSKVSMNEDSTFLNDKTREFLISKSK